MCTYATQYIVGGTEYVFFKNLNLHAGVACLNTYQ